MNLSYILTNIPDGLKEPLIDEYNNIIQCYLERKWGPSELSGGKFSEIVFTILDGHAKGTFALKPSKPSNMVDDCKALEKNTHVPRSFRILIPRLLPALYEIRNNRNVGHVGGDVDPNLMDAQAVVQMSAWIMGEIIRVFHNLSPKEAQGIVDSITSRKIPLVWETKDIKRVLDTKIKLKDQILLLIASSSNSSLVEDLYKWTGYSNRSYFLDTLRTLHKSRFIELSADEKQAELLPPGSLHIEKIIVKMKIGK